MWLPCFCGFQLSHIKTRFFSLLATKVHAVRSAKFKYLDLSKSQERNNAIIFNNIKENKINFKPLRNLVHPLWFFFYTTASPSSPRRRFLSLWGTFNTGWNNSQEWAEFHFPQCYKCPKSLEPGKMSQIRRTVQIHHLEIHFQNRRFTSQLLSLTLKSTHQSSKNTGKGPLGSPSGESEIPWIDKWGHNRALTEHNVT